jgi:hypothetical protein
LHPDHTYRVADSSHAFFGGGNEDSSCEQHG